MDIRQKDDSFRLRVVLLAFSYKYFCLSGSVIRQGYLVAVEH